MTVTESIYNNIDITIPWITYNGPNVILPVPQQSRHWCSQNGDHRICWNKTATRAELNEGFWSVNIGISKQAHTLNTQMVLAFLDSGVLSVFVVPGVHHPNGHCVDQMALKCHWTPLLLLLLLLVWKCFSEPKYNVPENQWKCFNEYAILQCYFSSENNFSFYFYSILNF